MTITLLEKAARILEVVTEEIEYDNIECMRITPENKTIKYKNEELQKFSSLVYRLVHAGLCANKLNSCKHPEWEAEVEKMYRELSGNGDVPKN